jgi:hypothetical protein
VSSFTETVKPDTPRLVVTYHRDERAQERFQWGVVGEIPILALLGAIARAQDGLLNHVPDGECPERALVIAWNALHGECAWFVHPDVPVLPLVGMLGLVRATIEATHMARQAAAQQVPAQGLSRLLGPDGAPLPRG